jgi:hypothetical protein
MQGDARTEMTTTEARQGTHVGPVWVLGLSLALAVVAGLGLRLGWFTLPWTG